jgi:hypothetical protein
MHSVFSLDALFTEYHRPLLWGDYAGKIAHTPAHIFYSGIAFLKTTKTQAGASTLPLVFGVIISFPWSNYSYV